MRTEKSKFWLRLSAVLWLIFGATTLFAQNNHSRVESRNPERIKKDFPLIQLPAPVRSEQAVEALGRHLPEVAQYYGKSSMELQKLLRRDRSLLVSRSGRLIYACELEVPLEGDEPPEPAEPLRDQIVGHPLDQTFQLHSLPGSKRILYLNFTGGTISGTAWNSSHNGGDDIIAAPFNLDGDSSSFSDTELERIQRIWRRVAEDYSPFDVDVTTEEPEPAALTRSNSSDQYYGNTVMITPTNFYPSAGGVSYVGSFNDVGNYYKPSWAFSNMLANGEKYIAEACSHEAGHSVGLHHQGVEGGSSYYQGQGEWAPIMGNSYYKNVTQWAKGEYENPSNTEDQLQIIQNYGLSIYPDDHGDNSETASVLEGATSLSDYGFIEQRNDVDVFQFVTGAGSVAFEVIPVPLGPDLKILAELRDDSWDLVAASDLEELGADISTTVPAGAYYLAISGTGSGDPLVSGYSDYASLGQYEIAGSVVDPGSLSPPTAVISASSSSGDAPLEISFSGMDSSDEDGVVVSYAWNFDDGSPVSNDPSPVHEFDSPGEYEVTLTVTDNDGLMDSASTVISATRTIHVDSIVLSSESSTTAVSAEALVKIVDTEGNPVNGAIVSGAWSGVASGSAGSVTGTAGTASLSSPQASNSGTFYFAVTSVSAPGANYDSDLNIQTEASIYVELIPQEEIPPIAVISASSTSGPVPLEVSFSGMESSDEDGEIVSYVWNFDDGSPIENSSNPSHIFDSSGSYEVTLTVTDNDGLTDSSSAVISVSKTIFVNSIVLSSESSTTAVSAVALVKIMDTESNPASGSIVMGSWTGAASGAAGGSTGATGTVSLSSPESSNSGTFTFTVTSVSASGATYDSDLNEQTEASIYVELIPEEPEEPLEVSFTSPSNGDEVSGIVEIQVSASSDVAISWVEVHVDGSSLGKDRKSPYSFSWDAEDFGAGPHTLTATVRDKSGSTETDTIEVSVSETVPDNPDNPDNPDGEEDTEPPTVTIVSPAAGMPVSGVVWVSVEASDNVGVTKVELYVDGKLESKSTSAPFTMKWNTKKTPGDQHNIYAKAYDAAGNSATSPEVAVTMDVSTMRVRGPGR